MLKLGSTYLFVGEPFNELTIFICMSNCKFSLYHQCSFQLQAESTLRWTETNYIIRKILVRLKSYLSHFFQLWFQVYEKIIYKNSRKYPNIFIVEHVFHMQRNHSMKFILDILCSLLASSLSLIREINTRKYCYFQSWANSNYS